MSAADDSIRHEIERLAEIHRDELARLSLRFVPDQIRRVHGTWNVPMSLGGARVDADEVNDLLRVIRRSLRNKTGDEVTVFIDPETTIHAA